MIQQYNIFNIISFNLINKTNKFVFLNKINPEYKFFKSNKQCDNHFNIQVEAVNNTCTKTLRKGKLSWAVDIQNLLKNSTLTVCSRNLGIRSLISYTALKNLYVRSILMDKLLYSSAALVHSAAFNIKGKAVILAGRPGVFKTSILMDAIRDHQASFIGEENCLIRNKLVYPFPLNIDSISYKISNYLNENPSGKFQKFQLGLDLLLEKSKKINFSISEPSEINTLIFLEKGNDFQIKPSSFEELLPKMIKNEVAELSIPPTHSLSGINYNYFLELMLEDNPNFKTSFMNRLNSVFKESFSNCNFFLMTSPKNYTKHITNEIINTVNYEE